MMTSTAHVTYYTLTSARTMDGIFQNFVGEDNKTWNYPCKPIRLLPKIFFKAIYQDWNDPKKMWFSAQENKTELYLGKLDKLNPPNYEF